MGTTAHYPAFDRQSGQTSIVISTPVFLPRISSRSGDPRGCVSLHADSGLERSGKFETAYSLQRFVTWSFGGTSGCFPDSSKPTGNTASGENYHGPSEGSGAWWWQGTGLAEHIDESLSLLRQPQLWNDQSWKIHVRGRCQGGWGTPGPWPAMF